MFSLKKIYIFWCQNTLSILFNLPSCATVQNIFHAVEFGLCSNISNFLVNACLVGLALNISDNTQSYRVLRVLHINKHILQTKVILVGIMNKNIILCNAILANLNNFKLMAIHYKSLIPILAKNHRFAILKNNCSLCSYISIRDLCVSTVIEDYTVYKHLHYRSALMLRSPYHYLLIEGKLRIQTASKECTTRAKDK